MFSEAGTVGSVEVIMDKIQENQKVLRLSP